MLLHRIYRSGIIVFISLSPTVLRRSTSQPVPNSQDRAGPSELQSFSDSLKSRFNAMSNRFVICLNGVYFSECNV